jgi:hypothetical protein
LEKNAASCGIGHNAWNTTIQNTPFMLNFGQTLLVMPLLIFLVAIPLLVNLWDGGQNSYQKPQIVFKWRNNGKSNMLIGMAMQPLLLGQLLLGIKQLRLARGFKAKLAS